MTWYKVGWKYITLEVFKVRINALREFQNTIFPYLKEQMKELEERFEEEKKGLTEEEFTPREDFLIDEYQTLKDMEKDFYLLSTVGIYAAIEGLQKELVGYTEKIKGRKYMQWDSKQLIVFYETIGIPITENADVNLIRKINNRYKHHSGICNESLANEGFGKAGEKIEITQIQMEKYLDSAIRYMEDFTEQIPEK